MGRDPVVGGHEIRDDKKAALCEWWEDTVPLFCGRCHLSTTFLGPRLFARHSRLAVGQCIGAPSASRPKSPFGMTVGTPAFLHVAVHCVIAQNSPASLSELCKRSRFTMSGISSRLRSRSQPSTDGGRRARIMKDDSSVS